MKPTDVEPVDPPRREAPPARTPARPAGERASLKFALRALRHRNYRLFFGGQLVSLVGTWMTNVATAWLVYRLTHSAFLLGAVSFASQIPNFLLGPVAGVLVDRWERRTVLVCTQVLAMVQSAALAVLTLGHWITVNDVLLLAAFQGLINAFDMPARQAFVVEMIEDRADLPNAIALNSSMFNAARLLGPSIGGVIIAAVGEGWCFAGDAVSYLGVIAALLAMRALPRPQAGRARARMWDELRAGWRYVIGSPAIRSILLLLGIVSLVGMPYAVLMPIFAAKILHGGPHTLGFLMAATGVGALGGAVYLATRTSVLGLGRRLPWMVSVFGAGLVVFSFSRSLPLSLLVLVFTGFGFMVQMASSNTLLQTLVDDDKRGRVMSFYAMAFVGTAPFGSLLAGAVAERVGAPWTLAGGGVALLLAAGWFATLLPRLREQVRPIYVARGILPPETEALRTTSQLTLPPE